MMQVSNFCCRCGLSLKAGSIIIGVWTMVAGVCALALALAWAYGGGDGAGRSAAEGARWAERARARGLDEAYVQVFLLEAFGAPAPVSNTVHVLLNIVGVIEAFHFNFSLILVFGILRERCKLVNWWVRFSMLALLLRVLLLTIIAIIVMSSGYVTMGLLLLFGTVVLAPLSFYFIVVVHSYHYQLQRKEALKNYANDWQG